MKKIIIVGGGTAGLTSALILKTKYSFIDIHIIKSNNIGIIGVGEGTTEHWREFINFVGIHENELIKEADATFKYGVYFKDWTKQDYVHNVSGNFDLNFGQQKLFYSHCISNKIPNNKLVDDEIFNNTINSKYRPNQFHFNTFKLNEFLIKKCKQKNIKFIEDEIKYIKINNNKIKYIKGIKKYTSDFFIDCTGFKKLLIKKLGGKWNSYSKYLPMNEAIAFPTADTKEYDVYTLSKAMTSGWMWRIPTYGRWGNGYVFNNNYINAEQAKKECENYLGFKVQIAKNIKFEAGALEDVWIGNCCAIGLSANFIEPLEATSIGTSIQQIFLLMHYIINYNDKEIMTYNKKIKEIVYNIRDFVILHYLINKKDSKFWKELKVNIPDSLKNVLEISKRRLLIKEDFNNNYLLFNSSNFIVVMYALGLLNINNISNEYSLINKNIKQLYLNNVTLSLQNKKNSIFIKHKEYLTNVRNNEI
jgi:flavin-dependent dehydrogenase